MNATRIGECFVPVPYADIEEAARSHLAALPSPIDSFLEDHILASAHYRIVIADEGAGFASIHQESLITQFALDEPYRRYGQSLYAALRRVEQVRAAFVPTCDELFLAHALDDYRQLRKQAYVFATSLDASASEPRGACTLRRAAADDAELIRRHAGDLFDDVERRIADGELYVTERGGEPVGFGILTRSALYDDVASIGMVTIAAHRRQGVGTATIALLIDACRRRGLRAVAGCWYYNHVSKRTLELAGMFSATRLLKVAY